MFLKIPKRERVETKAHNGRFYYTLKDESGKTTFTSHPFHESATSDLVFEHGIRQSKQRQYNAVYELCQSFYKETHILNYFVFDDKWWDYRYPRDDTTLRMYIISDICEYTPRDYLFVKFSGGCGDAKKSMMWFKYDKKYKYFYGERQLSYQLRFINTKTPTENGLIKSQDGDFFTLVTLPDPKGREVPVDLRSVVRDEPLNHRIDSNMLIKRQKGWSRRFDAYDESQNYLEKFFDGDVPNRW